MPVVEPVQTLNPISLPDIAAVAVRARHAVVLTKDGEVKTMTHDNAAMTLHKNRALVCHAPYTRSKLGKSCDIFAYDLLELFAFVHPATFATPTIHGLCAALGMPAPQTDDDLPAALFDMARHLLTDIQNDPLKPKADALEIARVMGLQGKGWAWTPFICDALGEAYEPDIPVNGKKAMAVWKALPEWVEDAQPPAPSLHGVSPIEAEDRLDKLLGEGAEQRVQQKEYAAHITHMFAPPATAIREGGHEEETHPHVILAEAGTGVGKTLGYLAPASVWAEKNDGAVWISTYTKNLQRQIDQELDKLYPDEALKNTHVAVRKGRENYLCLLNLEDTVNGAALARTTRHVVAAGIMARWAAATKDGDLTGEDFPGWLTGILGYANTTGLADRRGECVYSACDHYARCFVERSARKATRARIVVANHALSMISAAMASPLEVLPARYIFDEGHHLFNAADSAFAAHLTARETKDLRRWILGAEGGRRSRARGLKRRAEDLCVGDAALERALRDIIDAAQVLSAHGWEARLRDGEPRGACEAFLHAVYAQVSARNTNAHAHYSIETEAVPVDDDVLSHAKTLHKKLKALSKPMLKLAKLFQEKIAKDSGDLSPDIRKRLDAISGSLDTRARGTVAPWAQMLEDLWCEVFPASVPDVQGGAAQADSSLVPPHRGGRLSGVQAQEQTSAFIDWLEITRVGGKTADIGYYRHHTDPMRPFANAMRPHAHGIAVTSATLRDKTSDKQDDKPQTLTDKTWDSALRRSGAAYLSPTPIMAAYDSPFDYAQQSKVIIIQDVNKNALPQVAGAMRSLITASGGGAVGLFTAINRMRAVHGEIAADLEDAGLALYAQHVDEIDTGTLIDMFREDKNASLFGTDAVRDGMDVPGTSLRLLMFDRTPWPRPDILHKARRAAFGKGRAYDDMMTRLKLKQAFGRLIRRADDKGVFVMLDFALPSKLHDAFPAGVEIQKCGLAEAVRIVKEFL